MKSVLAALVATIMMLAPQSVPAQQDRIWAFGGNAGLDFNVTPPAPIETSINSTEGAASITDAAGQLLFYTDGGSVWDRNDNLMPNGTNLTPVSLGPNATTSTSQGTVIVPMPGSSSKYYIFSLSSFETWPPGAAGFLYYSVVDMTLNTGLGDVIPTQKTILIDSMLLEKMTVARGDRCNLWLIVSAVAPAVFKTFEITEAGINTTPVMSTVGTGGVARPAGVVVVSPDGRRLGATHSEVFGTGFNSAIVYDFNPATGIVTNPLVLLPNFGGSYGFCFSPDNTKAYVQEATGMTLWQFDLSAGSTAAILASKTMISSLFFTHLRPGPDGKIYMRSPDVAQGGLGDGGVAVIHQPNLAGTACNFDADAIALLPGTSLIFGLPNVVQYVQRDTQLTTDNLSAGCFATSTLLQAANTGGWGYQWSNGTAGTSSQVNAPGTYYISYYTSPCTYHADTFQVTFPYGTLPEVLHRSSCKNSSNGKAWISVPAWDTVAYACTWRNSSNTILSVNDTISDIPSGSYTVEVTTSGGCDTTLSFYLSEEDFRVSFDADTLVCTNEIVSFQNTSDGHFTQFSWDFGDATGSVLEDPTHNYLQAGNHRVMLIGRGEICTDTAFREITVDTPMAHLYFTKDQDNICTGQSILLTPALDSTMTTLVWSFDQTFGVTEILPGPLPKAFDLAGVFPVQLTARFRACPDLLFHDTITVHPLPLVDLGPDSSICLNGKAVSLRNRSENIPGSYLYHWSTGESSETIQVKHHGTYGLTLTNTFGCTASETVTVKKDCYIDIPNAFTPNGDGVNDYFFPRQLLASRLTKFRMTVYNRWGQVIFETHSAEGRGWDGRFNSKDQPGGVYVYLIDAALAGNIEERYQGNVTLIR